MNPGISLSAQPTLPQSGAPVLADDSLFIGQLLGSDLLIVLTALLGVLAAGLTGAVVAARRDARLANALARRRGYALNDAMRTVAMAEEMAGIGVWQYNPNTGVQQWSRGLRRLFGINHSEAFVEGDAETLLFANNIDLIGAVSQRLSAEESYDLHFDIYGFDGVARSLCVQVHNLRHRGGSVFRVVAVVRDITVQLERERDLESSRAEAVQEASRAIELAETDALTGLANRRRVMDRLDRLIVEARASQQSLVLVMFDIDHFKQVNDTHGHLEGDKVLQNVARIAESEARGSDIVGRVGGEEFVWIVPGATVGLARVMSERLRQAVASHSATQIVPPVTVSAGFAQLREGDTSLSLFARADSALYEAKGAGRNRVRMAA